MKEPKEPDLEKIGRKAYEIDQAKRAWYEAVDRLSFEESWELLYLTGAKGCSTAEQAKKYLQEHRAELTPEGIFFLETTIYWRELKESKD